ncbi:hypothetical protein ASN18_3300 [Candidatus Magnetominusculus xianensis]|uniref:Uncharacterized protein n=1 Tax=Candidatus Magnetominusculus xianensis TaxID=1748249 RepID=A0ABR5SEZ2_9BACT|nr:hypothetical protein ASN18_3300 [Candidatus Magnetominusculus xianensis]
MQEELWEQAQLMGNTKGFGCYYDLSRLGDIPELPRLYNELCQSRESEGKKAVMRIESVSPDNQRLSPLALVAYT